MVKTGGIWQLFAGFAHDMQNCPPKPVLLPALAGSQEIAPVAQCVQETACCSHRKSVPRLRRGNHGACHASGVVSASPPHNRKTKWNVTAGHVLRSPSGDLRARFFGVSGLAFDLGNTPSGPAPRDYSAAGALVMMPLVWTSASALKRFFI